MNTASLAYKQAFEAYIRRGTPIALSFKQARPTTHYIWRTRRDGQVRPSHAANEGKIFAWDSPPPTGHPGDEYGCRCTAEPFYGKIPEDKIPVDTITEQLDITMSGISDAAEKWGNRDFAYHYFFGKGRTVTLRETGHLQAVVDEYRKRVTDNMKRLPGQIADEARKKKNGSFSDTFRGSYRMHNVIFSLGYSTIKGIFSGNCSEKNGVLTLSGNINFEFEDAFKDPVDIYNEFEDDYELPLATPYDIEDAWQGTFAGKVYADRSKSRVRYEPS